MSIRYVWLKNNLALNVTGQLLAGQWFSAAAYPSGTLHIGESVHASGNKVELNESATKTINSGASSTIASENYGYISTDSGSHYPSNADLWHNNTNVNANILSSSQGWQLTSGTLDIIRGWKKGSNTGTISNASSSTYPLNNNAPAITNICAIIPQLIRGYKHVR